MPNFYPVLTITLTPSGTINPYRFVNFAGAQAGAGEAARGVTHDGAEEIDKAVPVIAMGTAVVEAGAAFAAEAKLVSDADGRAIAAVAASGDVINAVALGDAAAAGDLVEVILVPPVNQA